MITTYQLNGSIQRSYLFLSLFSLCFEIVFLSVQVICPRDSKFSFVAAMTAGFQSMRRLLRIRLCALGGEGLGDAGLGSVSRNSRPPRRVHSSSKGHRKGRGRRSSFPHSIGRRFERNFVFHDRIELGASFDVYHRQAR